MDFRGYEDHSVFHRWEVGSFNQNWRYLCAIEYIILHIDAMRENRPKCQRTRFEMSTFSQYIWQTVLSVEANIYRNVVDKFDPEFVSSVCFH